MRKIALIMDSWKRYVIAAWPSGIMNRINETHENVSLYIFCCAGNWSEDSGYDHAEYNIFRLPDLNDFDGVIFDINNISSQEEADELISRIRDAHIPAVSIGSIIKGCIYCGLDNYHAMETIVSHLYEVHHITSYWLIMGPENNYESGQRELAIRDYLSSKGITIAPEDVVHGGFDYQSGVDGYRTLRSTHDSLPGAVICVNDNLAISVCEEASKEGLKVPDDFAVTGFDNFDKAGFYTPRITTVENRREDISYLAMDTMIKIWNGIKVPDCVYSEARYIIQESCGCHSTSPDFRMHLKRQVIEGVNGDRLSEECLSLDSSYMQCKSIYELADTTVRTIKDTDADGLWVVIDPNVLEYHSMRRRDDIAGQKDEFHKRGYPEEMMMVYSKRRNEQPESSKKIIRSIFPTFEADKPGESYLFLPVHFGSDTIGYVVISSVLDLMLAQVIFQIKISFERSADNLYKQEKMNYMNMRLNTLYRTDSLTGISNRMGYQHDGEAMFKVMNGRNKRMLVLFCDLDRLKYINDTFGHVAGDTALIYIADAMSRCSNERALVARTGGDEFIVLQEFFSREDTDDMITHIRQELADAVAANRLPYDIVPSIGWVATDPADRQKGLEEYVREADSLMYEEKERHKAVREKE